jgi:choline transport protein
MNDNMSKVPPQTARSHDSIELANTVAVSEKHGTQSDERDMDRMGKLQELRVRLTQGIAEE